MSKKSAGFVIFRINNGKIEYLLLQASKKTQHWTPPKGHIEAGESDLTAAYRETEEETGLTENDFKVYENSQQIIEYQPKRKIKTVVYWLAQLTNDKAVVKLSHEHLGYKWLPLEETSTVVEAQEHLQLLRNSENLIKNVI